MVIHQFLNKIISFYTFFDTYGKNNFPIVFHYNMILYHANRNKKTA